MTDPEQSVLQAREHCAKVHGIIDELRADNAPNELTDLVDAISELHKYGEHVLDQLLGTGQGKAADEPPGPEQHSNPDRPAGDDGPDLIIGYQVKHPDSDEAWSQHQRLDLALQARDKAERLAGPGHQVLVVYQSGFTRQLHADELGPGR